MRKFIVKLLNFLQNRDKKVSAALSELESRIIKLELTLKMIQRKLTELENRNKNLTQSVTSCTKSTQANSQIIKKQNQILGR